MTEPSAPGDDNDIEFLDPPPPEIVFGDVDGAIPELMPLVECWRCGKLVDVQGHCPWCGASGRNRDDERHRSRASIAIANPEGLIAPRLLATYSLLLASSVVYGWFIHFGLGEPVAMNAEQASRQVWRMLFIEVFDAVVILASLFWIPRPPKTEPTVWVRRLWSWATGAVLLGVALAANFGYHRLILYLVGREDVQDEIVGLTGLTPVLILAYCVQPAIFEELFFRHLALGNLRRVTGLHGAVWASSIMFGMCHIGVPLSIPILTLVGVALGYARVLSGSLALPIVMHFAHNLLVIIASS
jgi:membrane protease YdiL (CAAX protease family)